MQTASSFRRHMIYLLAALLLTALAAAGPEVTPAIHHGYVFGSGGHVRAGSRAASTFQYGAGLELAILRLHEKLPLASGAAIEIAGTGPLRPKGTPLGVFSVNVPAWFPLPQDDNKSFLVQPFLTGGYSVLFGDVAKSRWNYGGGVTWWLDEWKLRGIRVEVRDHVPLTRPNSHHDLQFRLALMMLADD